MKLVIVLLCPSILWGCQARGDDGGDFFLNHPASTKYVTPGGLTWEPYGPIPSNTPGPNPRPDDMRWADIHEVSAALDARVEAFAAANPSLAVWVVARGLRWCVVDDYCFPDGGADDSTTGYASGLTCHYAPMAWVCVALWSRKSDTGDPGDTVAPWCKRTPIAGTPQWRWGAYPMLPTVGYELGNVFWLRPQ